MIKIKKIKSDELFEKMQTKIMVALKKKKDGWYCIVDVPQKNIFVKKYLGKTKEDARQKLNKIIKKLDIPVGKIKFMW